MLLSKFYGEDEYIHRKAFVFKEGDGFVVTMIDGQDIVEDRKIVGHSEQFAEDCAENFVLGVIR